MRWGLIFARGSVYPLVVLIFAGLIAKALWSVGDGVALPIGALASWGNWAWLAGCCFAAATWGMFGYRLRTWEKGKAASCAFCGGPLGRLRDGRIYYGRQLSDFRRCYNCSRANHEPDYF